MRLKLAILSRLFKSPFVILPFITLLALVPALIYLQQLNTQAVHLKTQLADAEYKLAAARSEAASLKSQDQYQINQKLSEDIKKIEETYQESLTSYEDILDMEISQKTDKLNESFASILKLLAQKNYASAQASLSDLNQAIQKERDKLAAAIKIPGTTPAKPPVANNNPPSSGYQRQLVQSEAGSFTVDIVSADLNSTKVIVDTASDSDCGNDCPVLPLGDYVSRNGAFAGINGSYFCPASYPSCAGKTNSFDTLLMNKNKRYLNSDNNVYSVVPAAIFSGSSVRYVSRSLEWGRDTGVDAVLANYPLLLLGGNIVYSGSGDAKLTNRGPRNFVGSHGSTVYIGIVHGATLSEAAQVLKTLGLSEALNLDSGGSSALWSGGYKYGPGRNIPNALLFIRR